MFLYENRFSVTKETYKLRNDYVMLKFLYPALCY